MGDPAARPPAVAIDALLPQTQCGCCGYAGCAPYADALACGADAPDRCAPGGDETLESLSALLGTAPSPLDLGGRPPSRWRVAVIDEPACIGCALCLDACPVDAIVGARRFTHTVIESECTGCELCLPVCPVSCIDVGAPCVAHAPAGASGPRAGEAGFIEAWLVHRAGVARGRHGRHLARPPRTGPRRRVRAPELAPSAPGDAERRAEIAAAVRRVRERRVGRDG